MHNKKSRRHKKNTGDSPVYTWHLLRYVKTEPSGMLGLVVMPANDLGNGMTEAAVLEKLNSENCFDFDYTPQEKDDLQIQVDEQWNQFLSFTYQQGKWVAGSFYDAFDDVMEDIGQGKLKLLNNKAGT